jgi:hypothetical protein
MLRATHRFIGGLQRRKPKAKRGDELEFLERLFSLEDPR